MKNLPHKAFHKEKRIKDIFFNTKIVKVDNQSENINLNKFFINLSKTKYYKLNELNTNIIINNEYLPSSRLPLNNILIEFDKQISLKVSKNKDINFKYMLSIYGEYKKEKERLININIYTLDENEEILSCYANKGKIIEEGEEEYTEMGIPFELENLLMRFEQFISYPEITVTKRLIKKVNNKKNSDIMNNDLDLQVITATGKLAKHIYKIEEHIKKQKFNHNNKMIWVRGHYYKFWDRNHFRQMYLDFENNKIGLDEGYFLYNNIVGNLPPLTRWVFPFIRGMEMKNE